MAFTSKLNTMTGKIDWEIVNDEYDYQQELARAGFADMLHDHERNVMYYEGLKKVIGKLKRENKRVHVLDIGTGTGLLSMMAVRSGADKVTTCEAFKPMAKVAEKCIRANKMDEKIHIINKRSTDVVFGVDMTEKANVLVAEVFDTELIGEGAISTFKHALENLMMPSDQIYVVPDNGTIFVQLVESDLCRDWNWLDLQKYGLKLQQEYKNLSGDAILDLQMTEFNEFKAITDPIPTFKFSFSGKKELLFDDKLIVKAKAKANGTGHCVFMWWTLGMDYENEIVLSCAPVWAHHDKKNMQWRDHWMQAIYYPNEPIELKENENFLLSCFHDEYSLWFDVAKWTASSANLTIESFLRSNEENSKVKDVPLASATVVSRNRLRQLNDRVHQMNLIKTLEKHSDENKSILMVNDDFSIISLLVAKHLKFKQIYVVESNRLRRDCLQNLIKLNGFSNRIKLIEKNLTDFEPKDLEQLESLDVIFSELSFTFAILPWNNLYLNYCLNHLKSIDQSSKINFQNLIVLPKLLRLHTIALSMNDLHKIRSPVGVCEGFYLDEFDKIIMNASRDADDVLEAHPMWEYPAKPLSKSSQIFAFNFKTQANEHATDEIRFKPDFNGVLNGFAVWYTIDYDDDENGEDSKCWSLDTGLLAEPVDGENLKWNKDYKQCVHILDKQFTINDTNRSSAEFVCKIDFDEKAGKFRMSFNVIIDSK